jgi:hypothetical protein
MAANRVTDRVANRNVTRMPRARTPERLLPCPGERLRTAVDSVLADLSAEAQPDPLALHRFDDTLRGALAWTAAVGDTCQIAGAVKAVRNARKRLDMADADQARAALLSARDDLVPGQRSRV